jgi:hypothetical protein
MVALPLLNHLALGLLESRYRTDPYIRRHPLIHFLLHQRSQPPHCHSRQRSAQSKEGEKPELKPKIKDPPTLPKQPVIILGPPPRKKPRKAEEILRILDDITDSAPKRAKRAIADIPRPQHNRLQIVPA